MKLMSMIAGICAGALALAAPALAGDGNPPPWRGLPLTTTQGWNFVNGPGVGGPNMPGAHNPFTWPQAPAPMFHGGTGAQWGPSPIPDPTGQPLPGWFIPPGGNIEFMIPNNWDPFTIKEVWVQIKFSTVPGVPVVPPDIRGIGFRPDGSVLSPGFPPLGGPSFGVTPGPVPGMWETTLRMQFDGNPAWEIIQIFNPTGAPIWIHQIVIDTICPTPGTAAAGLIGLGLVGTRRRR